MLLTLPLFFIDFFLSSLGKIEDWPFHFQSQVQPLAFYPGSTDKQTPTTDTKNCH